MAVGLSGGLPELHPVTGVQLSTACAAIKKPGRRDLVVMALEQGSRCAAVFTRNAFCAAPVTVARQHLASATPRYLLVNTGYANAGTGEQGLQAAHTCCELLAGSAGCRREEVLPFSTGIIGEPLPVQPFRDYLPGMLASLDPHGWVDAAHGIMTTDTVAKGASQRLEIDGTTVTVTGIAKGSGMICPDMATMLAFIATDARLTQEVLQSCLEQAVDASFNRITVDGDTSTNDACVLIASGRSSHREITATSDEAYEQLRQAVTEVCVSLAQQVVRDGEGASKFITIEVRNGRDEAECRRTADTVAHSPLVKTAMFAGDPNWGRILAAVGRSDLTELDVNRVDIMINGTAIVRGGCVAPDYEEQQGLAALQSEDIEVCIDLGRGSASAAVWTCDLSYEYIRINADYRT